MISKLASVLALCCLAASTPVRAGEPCRRAVVIRDGRPFAPETVIAPGFDPRRSATAPWCDGDLLPTSEVASLLIAESERDACRDELANERDLREIDRDEAIELLRLCTEARLECERDVAPPPTKPKPRPKAYERASFWVGAAITTAAITAAIVADDHPLLWAAGGAGLGIMVGGSF